MINDIDPEGWIDIPGYIGLYRASNHGIIYSYLTGIILTPWINNRGYYCLKLFKNGKRSEWKVHVLIAKTFHADKETIRKNEVHHKDFNKLNCRADNVEWCTRKRNMKYNYEKKTTNKKSEIIEQIEQPF